MTNKSTPSSQLVAVNWKPFERNSLLGFLDQELPSGMILRGCQLLQSNGRHWVGLPSKPAVDKSGAPVLGDNGKPIYRPIVEFAARKSETSSATPPRPPLSRRRTRRDERNHRSKGFHRPGLRALADPAKEERSGHRRLANVPDRCGPRSRSFQGQRKCWGLSSERRAADWLMLTSTAKRRSTLPLRSCRPRAPSSGVQQASVASSLPRLRTVPEQEVWIPSAAE